MKIIGTCIPVLDSIDQMPITLPLNCSRAEVKRVVSGLLRFGQRPTSWTEDITIDQAFDLWLDPELASHTKVLAFGDFIEQALKPRGYRIV